MNDPHSGSMDAPATREEMLSALFANMVIQQTNMAMMMLGKVAHPETGQFLHDLEAARMFIDQLEMIEAKTKGNLNRQEEGLLRQALSALRMAFVEAVDAPGGQPTAKDPAAIESAPAAGASAPSGPAPTSPAPPAPAEAPAPEESRKKFSKKY